MLRIFFRVSAVTALLLILTTAVWAQGGGTGELTGLVTDPSGAVVPNAKVELTNPAQGFARSTTTTEAGIYRFSALTVVGTYELKVEAQGFRSVTYKDIIITVGRTLTYDVKLEIGPAQSIVTVEAGTQLVQPTESQVSQLIDRRLWQSLPLETRDQNTFINTLSSAVPDSFGGTTRGAAVGGARPGMGNFLVEGYDNNDQGQGGRGALVSGAITSISPDAIQEYRVITSGFAAEYGKGGGFVNDTVLKSGTNEWHGSAFWYNRVQALAANSFFSNKAGIKDRLVRNQFGGSFGGPVVKDRTFFYATYEGHLRRLGTPVTTQATTQQFLDFVRTGAFATFMESDPGGLCNNQAFLDNFLGDGSVGSGGTPAPCPGAFAGSATLGPIFTNLLNTQPFPLATSGFSFSGGGVVTGTTDLSGNPTIVYPVPIFGQLGVISSDKLNQHRISAKVDHRFTTNDTLSGTFLFDDSDTENSTDGGASTIGPASLAPGRSIIIGLTYTRTFSPTTLFQGRASFLRHRRDFPNPASAEGIPAMYTWFDPLGVGFGNSSSLPQFFTDNQFQYSGSLTMVRGRHSIKLGAEYRRTRNGSSFQANRNGEFAYYGIEDMATDGFFGDEADLALLGGPLFGAFFFATASINPTTGGLPEFYRGYRANEVAMYVQDDWRILPRLTINAGLRWEYFGPPHNFRSGIDSNYYFGNAVTPITASTSTSQPTANVFFPSTFPLAAMVRTGAFQQRDHDIWQKDLNNFSPRLGFAWDVFGTQKLVVRGSASVFFDRMWNNLFENIRFNAPFFSFATLGFGGNGVTIGPLSSPGLLTVPFTSTNQFAAFGGVPSPRHMDQNLVASYMQRYSLGVQWEFMKSYVLEANYVTTLGNKLLGVIDINTFNGRSRGGNTLRINTSIAGDNFRTNAFRSNYHGMELAVRKSFSYGLQFTANYTWSHAIDQMSDAFNGGRGAIFRPTDNFNIALDRGSADFDIRHRFVTSFYYDLPFFKQHKWAGGWNVSGIVTLQGGVPIPIYDPGRDINADGYTTDRPVYLGLGTQDINDTVNHNNSPADGYFDTAQFRRFASNGSDCATFGTGGVVISSTRWWCDSALGRGLLRGPGFANVDFGIAKKFPILEKLNLTFQANFFNLFNHTNFGVPVGNFNSPDFGSSTSAYDARVVQLSLRLDF